MLLLKTSKKNIKVVALFQGTSEIRHDAFGLKTCTSLMQDDLWAGSDLSFLQHSVHICFPPQPTP